MITWECDIGCSHCYQKRRTDSISLKKYKELISYCSDLNKIDILSITGG